MNINKTSLKKRVANVLRAFAKVLSPEPHTITPTYNVIDYKGFKYDGKHYEPIILKFDYQTALQHVHTHYRDHYIKNAKREAVNQLLSGASEAVVFSYDYKDGEISEIHAHLILNKLTE